MSVYDAVVVGAGPNGLAAAVTLARRGLSVQVIEGADEIGGGTRTEELTLPGFRHDVCSALHPLGAGSPFLRTLPLEEHGLRWIQPEVAVAHPLGPDAAAVLHLSLEETADGLGRDGRAYRRLFEPLVESWDRYEDRLLGRIVGIPRHPVAFARFGLGAALPASTLIRARFRTPEARALLAGCAAHSFLPLGRPLTGAFALLYPTLAHRFGWPLAAGGSQAIADALGSYLRSLGGEIVTGIWVKSLADLPPSRVVLLDVTPSALAAIAGDGLSARYRRRLLRFRHGPAAFKLDYALDGPIPWRNPLLARAGTVHMGGSLEEIEAAEAATWSGQASHRPFTLVVEPTAHDPTRAPEGGHVVWAYAHVPRGSDRDFTDAVERQLESLAPGFGERVLDRHVIRADEWEERNPNLVGGDISGGAHTMSQLLFRPFPRQNPWSTPLPGVYLCSASTAPGAGAHGMCGFHAAATAIRRHFA